MRQYVEREGSGPIPNAHVETFEGEPHNLMSWVATRRTDYRKGELSAERVAALEALPCWEWDLVEADFQRGLRALRQYVEREGHLNIQREHVETLNGEPVKLGMWAKNRRTNYRKGTMSAERVGALEAIPGWKW